jgi:hypothetical protein
MPSWRSIASRSENAPSTRARARPSSDLIARLRRGKADLRRERELLPLPEKVRQVIELQRIVYPLLKRRRRLESWEHPWEVEP